ncbi:MAG: SH3 domain-containing protein [Bauldia sp.]|uniref:SH3 domain-containing protein n=1 Tax=Bauldia sp. TaxID=2575872 RepID=UPI001DF3E5E3|nr:SH3 domain-containing protein [Bauldia sp.]MCB1496863.1 SH3 domain-containing protein [Bauldia sp.]
MRSIVLAAAILVSAGAAEAAVPRVNATCPGNITVHADQGGPVYINGREAELQTYNKNYYEARRGHVTISLTVKPDGTPDVSYTRGRDSGVCQVVASGNRPGGNGNGGNGGGNNNWGNNGGGNGPNRNPDYADGMSGGPDYWRVTDVPRNDTLNVRRGPGTNYAVLGELNNGDIVRNRGCKRVGQSRWCEIEAGEARRRGWVNGNFLRESGPPR